MVDIEKLTKETVRDGGVVALLYFDLHGKDKGNLTKVATGFVQRIIGEEGVAYAVGEIDEPLKQEDMYSTSVEVKVLAKDFSTLSRLCSSFSPFSVEILEPGEIRMGVGDAQELLLNISTVTYDLKRYIYEKVANAEDRAEFMKGVKTRMDMGKKLLEKGK